MRLNEPTNRANSNIVNSLLGDEKRYGGSKSSLYYKAKVNEVLTTAKNEKNKNNQKNQSDQDKQRQQQQEADRQNSLRSGYPTRFKERTGIPPRRYELSDIAKMNEKELMAAVREDPEFAAAVQQYSAQLEQKEKEEKAAEAERNDRRSKPSSPPVAERRKARLAKSSSFSEPTGTPTIRPGLEEYPDHIRELMDSGVPVTQWIVLLLLVGVGLYYLMGPELKEGLAYIMKQTGKTKKRSQHKGNSNKFKPKNRHHHKGKKKAEPPRKSFTVDQRPAESASKSKPETLKRESLEGPSTKQEISKETVPQPSAEKPKKKKNKKKNKKETETEVNESLDLASTDDGSTHHSDAEETPAISPSPPALSIPLIQMEPDDNDGAEWETVTRSRKPVAKPPPATTAPTEEVAEAKTEKVEKTVMNEKVEKTATTSSQIAVEKTSQSIDIEEEIEAAKALSAQEESADDGWETVTKSRNKSKASAPDTESSNSTKEKAKVEKQETKFEGDKKPKKKTSKKKKEQTVQAAKSNKQSDVTDGDAALALKLQMEEEKLAGQQGTGQAEEQWEEVKKNKNKKGQKATSS